MGWSSYRPTAPGRAATTGSAANRGTWTGGDEDEEGGTIGERGDRALDLAALTGDINAAGDTVRLAEHLDLARSIGGHAGPVAAADEQWLMSHDVRQWMGERSLPLWLSDPDCGFNALDSSRAHGRAEDPAARADPGRHPRLGADPHARPRSPSRSDRPGRAALLLELGHA